MTEKSFSHYRILHKLGEGGMGEVFLAHDERLDRKVALKFLPALIADDPRALERFNREAKAAAAVQHPNIITVHEVGVSDGVPYIAMAYVEGKPLSEALRDKPLTVSRFIKIASQVCDGLAEAHRNGIIHRDIKPGNIHIDKHERARILDFGLAMREKTTKITKEGFAVGTVEYMSPEQATGGTVDSRSDIFSLGTVMYEMLTGQQPFQGPHMASVVHAIVHEAPPSIQSLNPAVGSAVARVIERALEKDPANRYANADEMHAALIAANSSDERLRRIQEKKRRQRWVIALSVLAAVAAIVVWREWFAGRERAESIAVLPFENLSGNPAQDYYVDGMTEAITVRLAQIKALRVISKTSASHYRNSNQTIQQIAGELNVTKVVRGSVTRSDDRVRVTAQLIDARTDNHLWAETYDSVNVANVLDLQSQVALAIAKEVSVHVTKAERKRVLESGTVAHPQALEAYMQARYYFNRRTPQDITTALEYFKNAIEMDSQLAPAFTGIADCYTVRAMWNWDTSQNTFPLARDASERALAINPRLAEAHASLAMVELFYDWNWTAAETSFKRAIALNPNYATAYHWYGLALLSLGRYDDAIKQMKRACDIEPFSPVMLVNLAQAYDLAGNYDLANQSVDRAFKVFPEFGYAWLAKSWIDFHQQRYEDAVVAARTAMKMHVDRSEVMLVAGLDALGKHDEATAVLNETLARENLRYHVRAALYAYHGDKSEAITMAHQAIEQREWFVVAFRSRWYEPLQNEASFETLLKKYAPIKGVD